MNDEIAVDEAVAALARALAHPTRLRILKLLRREGAYVMHLTATLALPQANISQHLSVLRDAGLVSDERAGMSVVYRVTDERVFGLVEGMAALAPDGATSSQAAERRDGRRGSGRRRRCGCPRCRDRDGS